jgi:hypothetical protein
VRHLTDGTLRRIVDEPLALTAADQAHFDGCAPCKTRFEEIAGGVRATQALLSLPSFQPQPAAALASTRARIRTDEAARPPRWHDRFLAGDGPTWAPVARPAIAVLVVMALFGGFTATGAAQSLLKVFEPHTFTAVQVSPSGLGSPGALLDYGQVTWSPGPPKAERMTDASAAAAQSGLQVLTPASLPRGIAGPVTYGVISQATGSITFDKDRLRDSAARAHVTVKPMPASLDGSTLYVKGGPALIELWGVSSGENQIPGLVIVQTRTPTVYSTGASAQQLQDYLLSQPGVPPEIAAQLKAIKDPTTTLPVPIPQGLATSRSVQVAGVQGLLVSAAFGAGVVWEKNGVIYAVGGQVTPDQALAIASSLP